MEDYVRRQPGGADGAAERHAPLDPRTDDLVTRRDSRAHGAFFRSLLEPHIHEHVECKTEIHSDANLSYDRLDWTDAFGEQKYTHKVVDHAVEYVRDNVHVNGLENFWSLLKRAIRGTYVSVEPFHLFRYLDEQAFRFNARKDDDQGRFMETVRHVLGRRLTYRQLIGADQPTT